MFRIAVFMLIGYVAVEAQVPFLGSCPDMETMPNFDLNQYLGKWYEAERYFALFEFGGKCVTADYNLDNNGSVTVANKQISSITGIESSIDGFARILNITEQSKITVNFPSLPVNIDAPYWVLDTDYSNYSVVWSCTNFEIFNTRNVWILTRERNPTLNTMENAYSVVDKHSISRAYFIRTDQKNCL